MKPPDFFIDKAEQYISEFEKIRSEYISFDSIFSGDTPYAIQQKEISDLKLKTKLLFSEFDKGDLFIDKIKEIDNSILESFDEKKKLTSYRSVLELFIEHINEFRK